MATRFQSNDVAVLYKYMGDNIKLATLPPFKPDYLSSNGVTLDRAELALRLRLDKALVQMIAFKTGIEATPVRITPSIQPNGTGCIYVEYSPSVEMSHNPTVKEYLASKGHARRVQNIAISFWTEANQKLTGQSIMPNELAEQILTSIDAQIRDYVGSAAAIARWNETVTQAQSAITALEALGMPVPNELRVKANQSKPKYICGTPDKKSRTPIK